MRKALTLLLAGACVLAACVVGATADQRRPPAPAPVQAQTGARHEGVRPLPAQDFRIEVLIAGSALPQYPAHGRRYVEARAGAEYELRVTNPLPVRVAVALAVDGLNTIDARHTTARAASKWVIEPYGTITLSGWQMSSTRARRFYFTTERDSYAARLGRAADIGLISAVFFRERRPLAVLPPPRPLYEEDSGVLPQERRTDSKPAARSAESARAGASLPPPDDESAATGIGRSVRNDVQWVDLELEAQPAAEVALRYEYRPALVRLGILPRPTAPQSDTLPRRERARGFQEPQFCPEP